MGLITRKAANAVTPTVELRKDGDEYNLVTSSTFKTTEMKFKPGEEFEEDRADGAKVCTLCIETYLVSVTNHENWCYSTAFFPARNVTQLYSRSNGFILLVFLKVILWPGN